MLNTPLGDILTPAEAQKQEALAQVLKEKVNYFEGQKRRVDVGEQISDKHLF